MFESECQMSARFDGHLSTLTRSRNRVEFGKSRNTSFDSMGWTQATLKSQQLNMLLWENGSSYFLWLLQKKEEILLCVFTGDSLGAESGGRNKHTHLRIRRSLITLSIIINAMCNILYTVSDMQTYSSQQVVILWWPCKKFYPKSRVAAIS